MFRAIAIIALTLSVAACGPSPMGASESAPPPADAPAATGPDYAGDFDLVGTEPFWGVKIRETAITLSRPDRPEASQPNPGARVEGEQGVWRGERLSARLTAGDCSDGMSDRVHEFFAEVTIDGETLKGCGDRAPAP